VTRSTPLAPMIGPDAVAAGAAAVRSPKTAELVAGTLRRMVVDGQLKDGDFLPNEAELMAHFSVSRPTLREAVRVLESERLVEVRRGSRTGARVRVPGPEIVARPAGLLLELSGATIADVMVARAGIEPMAARLLAESGTAEAFDELEKMLADYIPGGWQTDRLAETTGDFHRRMVELSGNATLAMMAGMLHEITVRQVTVPRPRLTGANTSTSRGACCWRAWRPSRSATSWARRRRCPSAMSHARARCHPTAVASPCRRL
jgi:GntR family transcriptional repressor for pyruvate dehydrogenase complex